MELKNFLSEFEGLSDERSKVAEQIKSHNLPVIIFGAAVMAEFVTDNLNKYDVEVSGYAVDAEYYKPNQTYLGKPVYNFDELSAQPDKYVFVLGFGTALDNGKRVREFMNDKSIIAHVFIPSHTAKITHKYLVDNADKFFETYNFFAEELSRRIMLAYLKTHIAMNIDYILEFFNPNQYFNELTSKANRGGGIWIAAHSPATR